MTMQERTASDVMKCSVCFGLTLASQIPFQPEQSHSGGHVLSQRAARLTRSI